MEPEVDGQLEFDRIIDWLTYVARPKHHDTGIRCSQMVTMIVSWSQMPCLLGWRGLPGTWRDRSS